MNCYACHFYKLFLDNLNHVFIIHDMWNSNEPCITNDPQGVNDPGKPEEEAEANVDGNVLSTPFGQEDGQRRQQDGQNDEQNILGLHFPCLVPELERWISSRGPCWILGARCGMLLVRFQMTQSQLFQLPKRLSVARSQTPKPFQRCWNFMGSVLWILPEDQAPPAQSPSHEGASCPYIAHREPPFPHTPIQEAKDYAIQPIRNPHYNFLPTAWRQGKDEAEAEDAKLFLGGDSFLESGESLRTTTRQDDSYKSWFLHLHRQDTQEVRGSFVSGSGSLSSVSFFRN